MEGEKEVERKKREGTSQRRTHRREAAAHDRLQINNCARTEIATQLSASLRHASCPHSHQPPPTGLPAASPAPIDHIPTCAVFRVFPWYPSPRGKRLRRSRWVDRRFPPPRRSRKRPEQSFPAAPPCFLPATGFGRSSSQAGRERRRESCRTERAIAGLISQRRTAWHGPGLPHCAS